MMQKKIFYAQKFYKFLITIHEETLSRNLFQIRMNKQKASIMR